MADLLFVFLQVRCRSIWRCGLWWNNKNMYFPIKKSRFEHIRCVYSNGEKPKCWFHHTVKPSCSCLSLQQTFWQTISEMSDGIFDSSFSLLPSYKPVAGETPEMLAAPSDLSLVSQWPPMHGQFLSMSCFWCIHNCTQDNSLHYWFNWTSLIFSVVKRSCIDLFNIFLQGCFGLIFYLIV